MLLGRLQLWLGKVGEQFDRLSLLNDILPVYQQSAGQNWRNAHLWVQIDEPALVLNYHRRGWTHTKPRRLRGQVKLLLTTYFEGVT